MDPWECAALCASAMLPQIFPPGDPLLQVPFAPEHRHALEKVLAGLPTEVGVAEAHAAAWWASRAAA